jgi:hypothetical protein
MTTLRYLQGQRHELRRIYGIDCWLAIELIGTALWICTGSSLKVARQGFTASPIDVGGEAAAQLCQCIRS